MYHDVGRLQNGCELMVKWSGLAGVKDYLHAMLFSSNAVPASGMQDQLASVMHYVAVQHDLLSERMWRGASATYMDHALPEPHHECLAGSRGVVSMC